MDKYLDLNGLGILWADIQEYIEQYVDERIASSADVIAGTDDSKLMTPAKVKDALDDRLGTS